MKRILPVVVALLTALPAAAQEWTRFRGPNGTGISEAKNVPVTWTEKDFLWRAEVPGLSSGQPVIWGDRLFLTSASQGGDAQMMLCFDKNTGKELWSKKYPFSSYRPGKSDHWSNSTPVVGEGGVYACMVNPQKYVVKAWTHDGKEMWSRELGNFKAKHAFGASPILYKGMLIVTNEHNEKSFVLALNAKTGKPVWQSPRKSNANTAYSTPCVLELKGRRPELLLTSYANGISSLDLATGKLLWETGNIFDKRTVASPVVAGDLVLGSCGSGAYSSNYLVAIRLGGRGNVAKSHLAYKIDESSAVPYVPTPLVVGNRVYVFADQGKATCFEAATGKIVWSERAARAGFYGSPVLINGRIYINTKDGQTLVLEASDEYSVVATNPLGEGCYSTPTVEEGRLYMKTFSHLVCIGGK